MGLGMDEARGATLGLGKDDLPAIYRSADAQSVRAQRWFLGAMAIQLAALIVVALAGVPELTPEAAWPAWVAVGALVLVVVLRVSRFTVDQDTWFEGRAAAESAKTLAWRYAVRGHPFGESSADPDTELVARLREILTGLDTTAVLPSVDAEMQITPAMRALRAAALTQRAAAYAAGRIEDQRRWYAEKARANQRRSRIWNIAFILCDAVAIAFALWHAVNPTGSNLLGVAGTLGAAITAWVQLKQHATLARAYSIAAYELSAVHALFDRITTEADWARFVDDAEQAISREHTLWRASRSTTSRGEL